MRRIWRDLLAAALLGLAVFGLARAQDVPVPPQAGQRVVDTTGTLSAAQRQAQSDKHAAIGTSGPPGARQGSPSVRTSRLRST